MSTASALLSDAFEARYLGGRDPWSFGDNAYELHRYHTIVSSLRMAAYGTVYEPGCAVGVLTQQLAPMARRLIALDFAPSAIEQAKLRCTDLPNVEFVCADLRSFVPNEPLDLVVFSEVGYYLEEAELSQLTQQLASQLIPDGEFIAVHWLGESPDHVLHGDRVHEILYKHLGLCPWRSERHQGFRLDSWIKE